jgi:hypothetical protein
MSDGYDVEVDMVQRHAANVARIAGQLDPALQAANSQSLPDEAFGIICAQIGIGGWLVSPLHDRGVTAVSNAVARADEINQILGGVASTYDAIEAQRANVFSEQEGRL